MHSVIGGRAPSRVMDRIRDRVDRGPTWGSIEVWAERYGLVRYRLIVFPPGTDATTRRWLRAWQTWCGLGVLGAAGLSLVLMLALPPAAALSIGIALYVAGWIAIRRRAGSARAATRRLVAVDVSGYATAAEGERCERLLACAAELEDADSALRSGAITPVAHEVVWTRIYDELEAAAPLRSRSRTHVDPRS